MTRDADITVMVKPGGPGQQHITLLGASDASQETVGNQRFSRRSSLLWICAFVLTVPLLAAINYFGNATGMFPSTWRPSQTARAWKTARLAHLVAMNKRPQALIFGSSRFMQVDPRKSSN